ncbi:hypothetical protein RZS08_02645, partial [Arthrospira platensis SPKY1]|nr:hypothetical protein [Arthrospira platensis SPKY1]
KAQELALARVESMGGGRAVPESGTPVASSLAQGGERGDKVLWGEDNPHYINPPEGWPPTNLDVLQTKPSIGLIGKLWKARPWKWIIKSNELGRVKFPIGTIPEYTIDVTNVGKIVDVIYGFS